MSLKEVALKVIDSESKFKIDKSKNSDLERNYVKTNLEILVSDLSYNFSYSLQNIPQ